MAVERNTDNFVFSLPYLFLDPRSDVIRPVHCATWRTEDAGGDGYWMLDACDESGQRWLVHHDDLLKAVVLLGAMLGVDWEDG